MAKSASSIGNYVALEDDPDTIRKKIAKAVTDSGDEIKAGSKKPAVTNLLTIMGALTDKTVPELEKEFDGKGYKEFKEALADTIVTALRPIQQTLVELEKNPRYVDEVLAQGAEKARPLAEKTLAAAKRAMGL